MRRSTAAALGILGGYAVCGLALAFGLLNPERVQARVGPGNQPGIGGSRSREKRLDDCRFHIERFERALSRERPERALVDETQGFTRRPARVLMPVLRGRVAEARAAYNKFDGIDNADLHDDLEEVLLRLEDEVQALYQPPSGGERIVEAASLALGTDRAGRSISRRAIASIGVALRVGVVTALLSVLIGTLLGALAGFYGGWIDHAVTWLFSTLASIPHLVLITVLVYALRSSSLEGTLIPLYLAFCGTFWIGPCRIVRGEVLRQRGLDYVQAARCLGLSRLRVLVQHVLPNVAHLCIVQFSLLFVAAVKSEVILSYLGLGAAGQTSWGEMIRDSVAQVPQAFLWELGAATSAMMLLILAFHVLGDNLQDRLDPRGPSG